MSSHVSLVTFEFKNFERLPYTLGSASSPVTNAKNDPWKAIIYPGGIDSGLLATGVERPMYICLRNDGICFPNYAFTFVVRNKHGGVFKEAFNEGMNWKCMTRSEVLDEVNGILDDGVLYVECLIQTKECNYYCPPNPVATDMLGLITSGNHGDASFAIGDEVFHLHKHIVSEHAPVLATMCEGQEKGKPTELSGITAEVFHIVLRYIYLGDPPKAETILELGREIIHTADYLGIDSLKMVAETTLIASCAIKLSNVVDYLLLADAKKCPLLREYAMSYISARPRDVLSSESFENLKNSSKTLKGIILAGPNNFVRASMTVDALRRKLAEKGLDVYGSRKALISRLEQHSNKRSRDDE